MTGKLGGLLTSGPPSFHHKRAARRPFRQIPGQLVTSFGNKAVSVIVRKSPSDSRY
jgi:hypothetical protein